jgi:hypothetical protein
MSESKDETKGSTESKDLQTTLEEEFQVNILDLIVLYKSLVERIVEKGGKAPCPVSFFEVGHTFVESLNKDKLIYDFVDKSNTSWHKCLRGDESKLSKEEKKRAEEDREEALFANISVLFPVGAEQLSSVKKIFTATDKKGALIITPEDKDSIWSYVKELIRMAILYVHNKRCRGKLPDGKIGYTKKFFPGISVKTFAEKFDVSLD